MVTMRGIAIRLPPPSRGRVRVREISTALDDSQRLLGAARSLRANGTDAERALWRSLRSARFLGYPFRRQQPMGPYIVDFVCRSARLVIEVDGGHHAAQVLRDRKRSAWLRGLGYRVIRFTDREVLTELGGEEDSIWQALTQERGGRGSPSP